MPDGLVLVHKRTGISSHAVLGPIKRSLGTRKVGHTGTLDPFADGLILALVGRATRLAQWFSPLSKCYCGVIEIGTETNTLDTEGTPVADGPIVPFETIAAAASRFVGQIEQSPPLYSAVHVNGTRAYQLAREGKSAEMPTRMVTINRLDVVPIDETHVQLNVCCSTGTYIRSLARDIAYAAGTRGYLAGLTRESIGPFSDADAIAPELVDATRVVSPEEVVRKLPGLPTVTAKDRYVSVLCNGGRIGDDSFREGTGYTDGEYAAVASSGDLLAIVERSGARWHYRAVFR